MSPTLTPRQQAVRRDLHRRYLFPCKGYWSAAAKDAVPEGFLTGASQFDSNNWQVSSSEGTIARRRGSRYYQDPAGGDSITTQVGLLEAPSKSTVVAGGTPVQCRQLLDIPYRATPQTSYYGPTAIFTDNSDLNHCGQPYVLASDRSSHVFGHEMGTLATPGTTHYPRSSSISGAPNFRMIPLPYLNGGLGASQGTDSSAIGYSRCTFPLQRLLTFPGGLRVVQAGGFTFFPNFHGTPAKTNGKCNPSTTTGNEIVRAGPWGHLPPLFPPTLSAATASTGANDKIWWDGDQFYVGVAFQNQDGSFSPICQPRAINAILTSGRGLITIGSGSGTSSYKSITLKDIPIGPPGTRGRVIYRTFKTNVSTASVRPQGMTAAGATSDIDGAGQKLLVWAVINNNTQTTFVASSSSDGALLDNAQAQRVDHIWPLPSRYAFQMERRVGIGFSRRKNPCAIVIAPTGMTNSRDLNANDDGVAGDGVTSPVSPYGTTGFAWRYFIDTSNARTFQLKKVVIGIGVASIQSITITATMTIQDLLDTINATTPGSAGGEWAAEAAPGTDPNTLALYLAPTVVDYSAIDVDANGNLTRTGVGVASTDIAVGNRCLITAGGGTAFPANSVVIGKTSNAAIQIGSEQGSAQSTTASTNQTVRFWSDTGDDSLSSDASWSVGNIRSFCAAFPSIVALRGQDLDFTRVIVGGAAILIRSTIDKTSVLFTSATPGASGLAPQSFFNHEANRASVPTEAGSFMGGALAHPFTIGYFSGGTYVLKNVKGANTGEDADYHFFPLSPRGRGCIQYGTVVSGDGWSGALTNEGYEVTDGERSVIISPALYDTGRKIGVLSYAINDMALDPSTTTQNQGGDTADRLDNQACHAAIMDGKLYLVFPAKDTRAGNLFYSQTVYCTYDFSQGIEASGLREVLQPDGMPYPWSPPQNIPATGAGTILRQYGPMVRTSDGKLFTGNNENNGSGAAGAIWEIETGIFDVAQKVGPISDITATTITASLSAAGATRTLTSQTAGNFRRVAIGARVTGSQMSGICIVTAKDSTNTILTISGTFGGGSTNQPYSCWGQEIEADGYLCCDHCGLIGDTVAAQDFVLACAIPTGETLSILHSYDVARATQAAAATLTATGGVDISFRAPQNRVPVNVPAANRSAGEVQEWLIRSREGSRNTASASSRPEVWGAEAVYRRLRSYS